MSSFQKGLLFTISNHTYTTVHLYIVDISIFVHICSIYLFHSSSTEKNRFELAFRIIRQFHHYHPPLYSWTSEMNSYSHESNLDPSVHLVPKEIPEVSTAVEAWHVHLRRQTVVPGMGAISIAKSWRVKETRVYHRDDEAWYIVKYWYTFLYNGLCVCDFIILHAYSGKTIKNKRFNELHRDIATPRPAIEVRRKEPQFHFTSHHMLGFTFVTTFLSLHGRKGESRPPSPMPKPTLTALQLQPINFPVVTAWIVFHIPFLSVWWWHVDPLIHYLPMYDYQSWSALIAVDSTMLQASWPRDASQDDQWCDTGVGNTYQQHQQQSW